MIVSVAWQLFERDAAGYEGWYATRRGRRADLAERALLERLLAPFATARSALEVGCGTDLSVFVVTLEFVERPALALAEASRVARQGMLVVALNRWSLGGLSRRWGRDARGSLLGRARDFTLASLHELASTAAGPRLRAFRWASALFPDGLARIPARIPLGGVIGIAVELAP